jgi:hypothetical protein
MSTGSLVEEPGMVSLGFDSKRGRNVDNLGRPFDRVPRKPIELYRGL